MNNFRAVFEAVCGTTIEDAIKEFEGSSFCGNKIDDLQLDEQFAVAGWTVTHLRKVERELHEMRLADIPRQVEAMRPKASRWTRVMRALGGY